MRLATAGLPFGEDHLTAQMLQQQGGRLRRSRGKLVRKARNKQQDAQALASSIRLPR